MADVEVALMSLLDDFGYTVTSTPLDLESRLPIIRVRRIGGSGDRDNDFPRVSVQVFTAAGTADIPRPHMDLAADVDDFLFAKIPGAWVLGVCFDSVAKDSGPVELTYPNSSVRVAESLYSLTTRR